MKRIHIFDIDGTLLDSSHRFRTLKNGRINLPYWLENSTFENMMKDKLLPFASVYKRVLKNPNTYAILATARQMTKADFDSIEKLLGLPNHFIYRKIGDTQSGTTLKVKGLKKLLNLKQFSGKMSVFYEDNIDYLHGVVNEFTGMLPIYVPSKQGV